MEELNWEKIAKERVVPDYTLLQEGEIDPSLGKKIKVLIMSSVDFIVYIDSDLYIEWNIGSDYFEDSEITFDEFFQNVGMVFNKIGFLESVSDVLLKNNPDDLLPLRRLLGEALARVIGEKSIKNAEVILGQAEAYLNERKKTTLIKSAGITTGIIVLIMLISWINENCIEDKCHECNGGYDILMGVLGGGLGAFFSLISRSKNIVLDVSQPNEIYRLDGFLRITYGMISAFIILLAIKSNIILPDLIKQTANDSIYLILLICIISGASERIIPSIITKIEDSVVQK